MERFFIMKNWKKKTYIFVKNEESENITKKNYLKNQMKHSIMCTEYKKMNPFCYLRI